MSPFKMTKYRGFFQYDKTYYILYKKYLWDGCQMFNNLSQIHFYVRKSLPNEPALSMFFCPEMVVNTS